MTIRTTQLSMGFSGGFGASRGGKPTCSSCSHRFVLTEQSGTWQAGSLKCTKGGFMTQPLARCNEHVSGGAMSHDPAVNRGRRIQIGPVDV